MTDREEDQLRQRLSTRYPAEPAPPAFLERITDTVASVQSTKPVRSIGPSTPYRSWWIAAAAAVVVAAGVTAIGLSIGSPPAGSAAGDSASASVAGEAASSEPAVPVTVSLPTSEWTAGMPADYGLGQGELVIGADGCLSINGSVVRWPKGFYGVETTPGTIEVHGPDGAPLIRTGEILTAGGGWGGTDPAGCTSEGGVPFYLEDEGFVSGTPLPADYGSGRGPADMSTASTTTGG